MRRRIIRFASHYGGRTQRPHSKRKSIKGPIMRNSLILFSLAALVAACSEQDQQPTSPARSAGATPASSPVVSSASQLGNAQAKPTDQVGFTQVSYLLGVSQKVAAGGNGEAVAMCPLGTQVTGGGYRLMTVSPGAMPLFSRSMVYYEGAQTGWVVSLRNSAPGATEAEFGATVVCVH
jgi:hypothetical protein